MRRTFPPELRAKGLELFTGGKSPTEVALILGVPVRTVQYWYEEYRREHGIPFARKKRPWAKQGAAAAPTQAAPSVAQALGALVEAIRQQVRREMLAQLGSPPEGERDE